MSVSVGIRAEGRVTIISLAGRESLSSDAAARQLFSETAEMAKFIVTDISGLESFDWEDLGILVSVRRAHRARWGAHMHLFKIVVRPGRQRVMVESMHMEHILSTYRSLNEALATMPRRRALHIEPEEDLASVVEILLEANGFEVIRFATHEGLPDRTELGDFDIVITELSFGGRAAPDVVRKLRLEFAAPVGVLTANPPEQILGAAFILSKPVVPAKLLAEVIRAMEQPVHQYYESIFDVLPVPLCIVSAQGRLQRLNRAWCSLFRVEPAVGTRDGFMAAFPSDCPHLPQVMEKVLSIGQGADDPELRIRTDGASSQEVNLHFMNLLNSGEEPHILITAAGEAASPELASALGGASTSVRKPRVWSAMLSLLEDLDAARMELSGANDRLKDLDRMKGEFISTVSHELRTPIAAIKGSIENLLDGYLGEIDPRQRRAVEIVLRNARRLARLIDNLLDLSRLEAGTLQVRRRRSDLKEAVRFAVEEVQPIAEKLGARVELDLPDDPVLAEVDPDRVGQIMVNLLDNGLRFSRGHVRVRLDTQSRSAFLRVEDDGAGIAEEDIPRLFERFSQVRSAAGLSHTGLGLSIVRGIVEEHGGRVWAENRPADEGGGARFVVVLPLPATEHAPHADAPETEERSVTA